MGKLVLGLWFTALAFAQPDLDRIKASDLRADLTFLAAPAMQGRMSLAPSSEAAIMWIAAEFQKAGVKPSYGDSYLQPVPLVEFRTARSEEHTSELQSH